MKENTKHSIKSKQQAGKKIKAHFKKHPEHRQAISEAQKKRWTEYKNALRVCQELGINLEVE